MRANLLAEPWHLPVVIADEHVSAERGEAAQGERYVAEVVENFARDHQAERLCRTVVEKVRFLESPLQTAGFKPRYRAPAHVDARDLTAAVQEIFGLRTLATSHL